MDHEVIISIIWNGVQIIAFFTFVSSLRDVTSLKSIFSILIMISVPVETIAGTTILVSNWQMIATHWRSDTCGPFY